MDDAVALADFEYEVDVGGLSIGPGERRGFDDFLEPVGLLALGFSQLAEHRHEIFDGFYGVCIGRNGNLWLLRPNSEGELLLYELLVCFRGDDGTSNAKIDCLSVGTDHV